MTPDMRGQDARDAWMGRLERPHGAGNVRQNVFAGVQKVQQDGDAGRAFADAGLEPLGDGRAFDVQEGRLEDGRSGRGGQTRREGVDFLARLAGTGAVADEEDGVQIFLTSETSPPRLLADRSASST